MQPQNSGRPWPLEREGPTSVAQWEGWSEAEVLRCNFSSGGTIFDNRFGLIFCEPTQLCCMSGKDVGGEGLKKLARPSSRKEHSSKVSATFDGEGPQLKKRTFPKVPPTFAELVMDFWLYSVNPVPDSTAHSKSKQCPVRRNVANLQPRNR